MIITVILVIFTDFASNRTPGSGFDPNLFCHLSAHVSAVRSPGAGGIGPVVSTRPRFFLRLVLRFDYLRSTSFIKQNDRLFPPVFHDSERLPIGKEHGV